MYPSKKIGYNPNMSPEKSPASEPIIEPVDTVRGPWTKPDIEAALKSVLVSAEQAAGAVISATDVGGNSKTNVRTYYGGFRKAIEDTAKALGVELPMKEN